MNPPVFNLPVNLVRYQSSLKRLAAHDWTTDPDAADMALMTDANRHALEIWLNQKKQMAEKWIVTVKNGGTFKTVSARMGKWKIVCNLGIFEPVENFLNFPAWEAA